MPQAIVEAPQPEEAQEVPDLNLGEQVQVVISAESAVAIGVWDFDNKEACSAKVFVKQLPNEQLEETIARCATAAVFAKREVQAVLNRGEG